MKLHTLKRSKGIVSKSKRLGRGNGSGKGNYSTKGLKGQKSRSGTTTRPFFEGGQTSIVQRIPKAKGFKRYYKLVKEVVIVNLGHLDADTRIAEGMEITKAILKDLGYIKDATAFVKMLGNGDWTKKVTFVDVDAYSKSAQEKIANPSAKSDKPKKAVEPKEEKKPAAKKVEKVEEPKEEKKPAAKKVEKAVEPKEEKKPAAKKPAAKKTTEKAEKPAAKKPAAKKTTTKKTKAE